MKTRSRQSSHRHMCEEAMQIQLYEELDANTASRIWKSCKVGGVIFNKGLKWSIANGESVSTWVDFWLPSGPLRQQIEGPLNEGEDKISAKNLMNSVECISFALPNRTLQEIKGIPIAANPSQEDLLIWAFSNDGSFSLKSAYLIAKGFNLVNLDTGTHQWVWKAHTSPRIKYFIWLCTHHCLPTKEVLGSRGLNLDLMCELCCEGAETIIHTLRDYKVARAVWRDLGFKENDRGFFGLNLVEWLKKFYGTSTSYPRPHVPWKILFPQAIWVIWLQRNKAIFQTGRVVEGTSSLCIKKGVEYYAIVPNEPNKLCRVQIQVKWTKPPIGWVKLNIDGTMYGNPVKVGGGGVFRSSSGDWIGGFVRRMGSTIGQSFKLLHSLIS